MRRQHTRLSASGIELYASCPRAYQLRYERELTSARYSSARAVGSAVHAGIQAWLGGARWTTIGEDIRRALSSAVDEAADDPIDIADQVDRDGIRARQMVSAYATHWEHPVIDPDPDALDVDTPTTSVAYTPEVELSASLRSHGRTSRSFDLHGRLDGIIRLDGIEQVSDYDDPHRAGRVMVHEIKTTSTPPGEVVTWLREGAQVHLYMHLLARHGYDVRGALLDVIRKPLPRDATRRVGRKTKPDESEADVESRVVDAYSDKPDDFFARVIIPYDEAKIEEVLESAWATARGIREARRHGFAATTGKHCLSPYGGWCEYRPVCWYHDVDGLVDVEGFDGAQK